jgi:hypothetical protein
MIKVPLFTSFDSSSQANFLYANTFFGENLSKATLFVDTMSASVAVTSTLCTEGCLTEIYDTQSSSSFVDLRNEY